MHPYYCVGCGGEMSAVLGDKREHHFRHKEAHCSWESYLHNPRSCRTADFIFEKKGILGLYDLKTVSGKGSVGTQLLDSIGQTGAVGTVRSTWNSSTKTWTLTK